MNLGKNDLFFRYSLVKRNLLLSSLTDGSLMLFRTDHLPRLPILASIRGYDPNSYACSRKIRNITINGKEFFAVIGSDCKIRIWNLSKGIIRLVKVIQTGEKTSCMIYLEDYQMIVTSHDERYIRFWSFISGKLKSTLYLNMKGCKALFLMKNKNSFGVASGSENLVKIVQLHP